MLTGSQAFEANRNRWAALREANRAIAAVVLYKYPEMQELQRAHAEVPSAVSVCAGIFKFSRDSGAARCAWQAAADAGPDIVRWAGLRTSAADGTGYASGNSAGPADDWMRKEHFDWQTWAGWEGKRRMGGDDRRRRKNWRRVADTLGSETHVHFARASHFAGDGTTADAFGLRWATHSEADAGCGSLCK